MTDPANKPDQVRILVKASNQEEPQQEDLQQEEIKGTEAGFSERIKTQQPGNQISDTQDDHPYKTQVEDEHNKFKAGYFAKFFLLYVIKVIFGPFTYFFICQKPKWRVLAKNLHIFGGKMEILRTLLWAIRVFAVASTIVVNVTSNPVNLYTNLYVNLYVLIVTDISLGVLYAAYYCSFRKSQINRLMEDPHYTESDKSVSTKLAELRKKNSESYFTSDEIALDFPEIDSSMLYFAVPEQSRYTINSSLKIRENHHSEFFDNVQEIILIDGVSVCQEALKSSQFGKGFMKFEWVIRKTLSRLIVLVRIIYPIAEQLYDIFKNHPNQDLGADKIVAAVSYVCYAILLFRFYLIYDALFLGLILYCEKLKLMSMLGDMIAERQTRKEKPILKISLFIPQNSVNWLSARRMLSNANMQIYTVVDVNLSFTLLYLGVYIAFILLNSVGTAQTPSFLNNPSFQIVTATYLIVMIIILAFGLVIGVLINGFFQTHRRILIQKLDILKNFKFYWNFYLDSLWGIEEKVVQNPLDRYLRELNELKGILRNDKFIERFNNLIQQNIKVLTHVKDQLQWDEREQPHRLLGLKTDLPLLITISSVVSALGISNVKLIISSLNITGKS